MELPNLSGSYEIGSGNAETETGYFTGSLDNEIDANHNVNVDWSGISVDGGITGNTDINYNIGAKGHIGYDKEDKNVGAKVETPVGIFGLHLGCKTVVCFFRCTTIYFC